MNNKTERLRKYVWKNISLHKNKKKMNYQNKLNWVH